jgi:hypothetical protein
LPGNWWTVCHHHAPHLQSFVVGANLILRYNICLREVLSYCLNV